MLVGHNYTRFVVFLAKTFFEIGCWAALVPRYEVLKTAISSLVQKNQFVPAFTDRVLLTQIATYLVPISVASRQSRAYLSYVGPISLRCWLYWLQPTSGQYWSDVGDTGSI